MEIEKCNTIIISTDFQVLGFRGPPKSVDSTRRATAIVWYGYRAPPRKHSERKHGWMFTIVRLVFALDTG
jgi:hypothetical protein